MSALIGLLSALVPPLALVAVLGTGIWFLGEALAWGHPLRIALIAGLATLVVAAYAWRAVARARRRARVQRQLDAALSPAVAAPAPLLPASLENRLESLLTHWREERAADPADLPCFLLLGEGGGEALRGLGATLQEAGPAFQPGAGGRREAEFWLGETCLIVAPTDEAAAALLPALRRRCHDLAGAVLAVPAPLLLELGEDALTTHAHSARIGLDRICAGLGMVLPWHLLLVRTGELHGCAEFFHPLDQAGREQAAGMMLPWQRQEQEERLHELGNRLAQWQEVLVALRPAALAAHSDPEAVRRAASFPAQIRLVAQRVQRWLGSFHAIRPQHEGGLLRGVWLAGAGTATRDHVLEAWDAPLAAGLPAAVPSGARSLFLTELFLRHLPGDGARPYQRHEDARRRQLRFRTTALAAIGLGGIALAGLALSFTANRNELVRLGNVVKEVPRSETGIAAPGQQLASLQGLLLELERLQAWEEHGHPLLHGWGLYQGDAAYAGLRRTWHEALRRIAIAPVQELLAADLRRDLDATARSAGDVAAWQRLFTRYRAHAMLAGRLEVEPAHLREVLTGANDGVPYWEQAIFAAATPDAASRELAQRSLDYLLTQGRRQTEWCLTNDASLDRSVREALHDGGEWLRLSYAQFLDGVQGADAASRLRQPVTDGLLATAAEREVFTIDPAPTGLFSRQQYQLLVRDSLSDRARRLQADLALVATADRPAASLAEVQGRFADAYAASWGAAWMAALDGLRPQPMPDLATALHRLDAITAPDSVWLTVLNRMAAAQVLELDSGPRHRAGYGGAGAWAKPALEALTAFRTALRNYQIATPAGDRLGRLEELKALATAAATASTALSQAMLLLGDPGERTAIDTQATAILRAALTAVGNELATEADARWRQQVLDPFQRSLADRFPFADAATPSAAIADWDALFAPGTGAIAQIRTSLETVAAIKALGQPILALDELGEQGIFAEAQRIGALFVAGADGTRSLGLELGFRQHPGVEDIRFSLAGADGSGAVAAGLYDSPQHKAVLVWPFRPDLASRLRIRVERERWLDVGVALDDPWGPLRICANATVESADQWVRLRWKVPVPAQPTQPETTAAPAPATEQDAQPIVVQEQSPATKPPPDTAIAPEVLPDAAIQREPPKQRGEATPPPPPQAAKPPKSAKRDSTTTHTPQVVEPRALDPLPGDAPVSYEVGLDLRGKDVPSSFFTGRWLGRFRLPVSLR